MNGLSFITNYFSNVWSWFSSIEENQREENVIISQREESAIVSNKDSKKTPRKTEEKLIHLWFLHNRKIRVLRKGTKFSYEILNSNNNPVKRGKIDFPEHFNIRDRIECLLVSQPTFDRAGYLTFENPTILEDWSFGEKRISLIREKDCLYWQLFDRAEKKSSQISFDKAYLYVPSEEYYKDRFYTRTTGHLYPSEVSKCKNQYVSIASFKNYIFVKLFNQRLEDVKTTSGLLQSVKLKPAYLPSKVDNSQIVDEWRWSVTLINSTDQEFGHAQIVIEAMVRGNYSMILADFSVEGAKGKSSNVPGKVKYRYIEPDKLHYDSKTETWLIPCKNVEKMMESIREDAKKCEDGKIVAIFKLSAETIFSRSSKNLDGEKFPYMNCLIWALDKIAFTGLRLHSCPLKKIFGTSPKTYIETYQSTKEFNLRFNPALCKYKVYEGEDSE